MTDPQAAYCLRTFRFPDDYPAVIDLWKNAGTGIAVRRSDDPDQVALKMQRDPDLFLVAEAGGEIVGTVVGGFDGRRGMVYHLAVSHPFRQQGVGTALMEELERRLREKGCIRSYLLVLDDNVEAMHFYEARGWDRMDPAVHIYGKDLS